MIIGEKDKERVKFLEKEIEDLKTKLEFYKQPTGSVDYLLAQIKDYQTREKEILTVLKAIISRFDTQEIVVEHREMLEAENYKLLKQNGYLSNAKIYRVINPKDILDSYKEK